jgi:hypothetical protein
MRHTLELLLCSAIGVYCLVRCLAVMPAAVAEARAVMAAAMERQRRVGEQLEAE